MLEPYMQFSVLQLADSVCNCSSKMYAAIYCNSQGEEQVYSATST